MFVGGVGEHLFLHWILILAQMKGTAGETIVQDNMIFHMAICDVIEPISSCNITYFTCCHGWIHKIYLAYVSWAMAKF
jgi:hypothetical protein